MRLHAFEVIYIADLDAILDQGDHEKVLKSIHYRHPKLRVWLDAGIKDASCIARRRQADNREHLVIASESLSDIGVLRRLDTHAAALEPYTVLSLDFHGQTLVGATSLFDAPSVWPERVIIMALASVGSLAGPNLNFLRRVVAIKPSTTWYAGGGIRHADDLRDLADIGVSGALVASALHDGAIDASTLTAYASHSSHD
jgi:phosphoribosylformimino-5-aminoimidazole carboxamide ribotide isomerase